MADEVVKRKVGRPRKNPLAERFTITEFPKDMILPVDEVRLNTGISGTTRNRMGQGKWAQVIGHVSRMTASEASKYYGDVAADLAKYGDNTLRELMVLAAIKSFIEKPHPQLWEVIMDREEGRVQTNISGNLAVNISTVQDAMAYYKSQGIEITEGEIREEMKQIASGIAEGIDAQERNKYTEDEDGG